MYALIALIHSFCTGGMPLQSVWVLKPVNPPATPNGSRRQTQTYVSELEFKLELLSLM